MRGISCAVQAVPDAAGVIAAKKYDERAKKSEYFEIVY